MVLNAEPHIPIYHTQIIMYIHITTWWRIKAFQKRWANIYIVSESIFQAVIVEVVANCNVWFGVDCWTSTLHTPHSTYIFIHTQNVLLKSVVLCSRSRKRWNNAWQCHHRHDEQSKKSLISRRHGTLYVCVYACSTLN